MIDDIVLYTTGCPKCIVLEKLMHQRNIKYKVEPRKSVMTAKGFQSVPMLEVNGEILDFAAAFSWANTYGLTK